MLTNSGDLFWGLSYETHQLSWSRIHGYYFGRDEDSEGKRVPRNHSTFGLRLISHPESDRVIMMVKQPGRDARMMARIILHTSNTSPWAYTFSLPWAPRILAMYDYASGTDSANGNYNQTSDNLFGARRSELINAHQSVCTILPFQHQRPRHSIDFQATTRLSTRREIPGLVFGLIQG